jgi:hypothetical protein
MTDDRPLLRRLAASRLFWLAILLFTLAALPLVLLFAFIAEGPRPFPRNARALGRLIRDSGRCAIHGGASP